MCKGMNQRPRRVPGSVFLDLFLFGREEAAAAGGGGGIGGGTCGGSAMMLWDFWCQQIKNKKRTSASMVVTEITNDP